MDYFSKKLKLFPYKKVFVKENAEGVFTNFPSLYFNYNAEITFTFQRKALIISACRSLGFPDILLILIVLKSKHIQPIIIIFIFKARSCWKIYTTKTK